MSLVARIVRDEIRSDAILSEVADDGSGAVLLFVGTVRDHAHGRPVARLRYEAYEPMALTVLEEILGEVSERTGVRRIFAIHRVGELAIGETSVAIAVSSPHRAEAYEASRLVIEEIKSRLPVWKKELFADGREEWVAGAEPTPTAPADPRTPTSDAGSPSR
jgi:molybdopterin synthase catalytic subunit